MKNIYVLENVSEILHVFRNTRQTGDKVPYAGNNAKLKISSSNLILIIESDVEFVVSTSIDSYELITEVFRRAEIDLVFE